MKTTPLLDVTSLGSILGIWAHPDDETYLSGGLLAAAVDAGQAVTVVIATAGEAGFDDADQWPRERAAWVRRCESAAAMAVLGVTDHVILDHRDGSCPEQDEARAAGELAAIIDRVAPDTILTFGPDGMTGHPDHRAVSRWVDLAVGALDRSAPSVLHAARTASQVERFAWLEDRFDVVVDESVVRTFDDEDVVLRVCLDGAALDRKLVALRAMATQTGPVISAFGPEVFRAWVAEEAFVAAPVTYPVREVPPGVTA